jgi:hypothetical protein
MKRFVAIAGLVLVVAVATAQTCRLTNISLTSIDGHDTFAGEIENDSGVDILFHKFRVTFLNSNLAIVETRTVDGCLRSLQQGSSDYFAVASTLPDNSTTVGLARLANIAEDPDFELGETEPSDIAITGVVAERTGGTLAVDGTITNHHDEVLEDPVACAVVFDEDGRVVTIARDTGIADLAAGGGSDTFSMSLDVPDDAELVDQVEVWADGLEDDVPVEPSFAEDVTIGLTPTPTASTTSTPTATPTATP